MEPVYSIQTVTRVQIHLPSVLCVPVLKEQACSMQASWGGKDSKHGLSSWGRSTLVLNCEYQPETALSRYCIAVVRTTQQHQFIFFFFFFPFQSNFLRDSQIAWQNSRGDCRYCELNCFHMIQIQSDFQACQKCLAISTCGFRVGSPSIFTLLPQQFYSSVSSSSHLQI